MGVFLSWLCNVTVFLLFLSGTISLYAVVRRREYYRLDVVYVVGCFALVQFNSGTYVSPVRVGLSVIAWFGIPYLLLRLARQPLPLSPWATRLALVIVPSGLVATFVSGRWSNAIAASRGASAVLCVVAGAQLFQALRRASGASRGRMIALAAGALALAGWQALLPMNRFIWPEFGAALGSHYRWLEAITELSLAIAFTPPTWLRARWNRFGEAEYLAEIARRDSVSRGFHAADDLSRAASRGVGPATTLVALGPADAATLVVTASSRPALKGLVIDVTRGLAADACVANVGVIGSVLDLGAVAPSLTPYGSHALVAPIGSGAHPWGVVIVVQRQWSIFTNDELVLVSGLARATATSLDHARLIEERRAREDKRTEQRLREVESHMALMLDSIKDYAMYVVDDAGKVVSWQGGAVQLFGYDAASVVDESAATLYDVGPDGFAGWLADARRLGWTEVESPCRRRDGSLFTAVTTIRPIDPTIEEGVGGFVAVTRDITAQRALDERIRQGQKMEAVGQLAGGIAHDFNNQLTAIIGYADSLVQELDEGDARRADAQQIVKAGERAGRLTTQLLTFSQRREFSRVAINLVALVDDLLPMLRRVIGEHIEIRLAPVEPTLHVLGDRGQLEQVVVNLAVNARDAMPAGGHLQIRIGRTQIAASQSTADLPAGPYARLDVQDDGVGMDATTRARIFEPFFTTKAHGAGTGLGLATVYGIVKQMTGASLVQSEPGRGTTFSILLPEVAIAQRVEEPTARPVAVPGRETVLLVEDEAPVRALLAHTLEKHGFSVICADRSDSALASLNDLGRDLDLVITDIVMPDGAGPELVAQIEQRRPGVRALFISGYADVWREGQTGLPPGAHFLRKPFAPADLLERVNQILASR